MKILIKYGIDVGNYYAHNLLKGVHFVCYLEIRPSMS